MILIFALNSYLWVVWYCDDKGKFVLFFYASMKCDACAEPLKVVMHFDSMTARVC